jgi:hypothetical protein
VLDDDIPQTSTKGYNLYLPDRGTMQRLVRRAADLKDLSKEKDKINMNQFKSTDHLWIR